MKEGGFNRVFIPTMDSGSLVVARLPTGIAGPPKLKTNSEVAAMTYLRSKTTLPIPKVLDWSDDPSNAIGAEYIIQEHVSGVQLHEAWPNMNSEQHMLCTKALSLALQKIAALDFPAYGSTYFSNADGPGPLDSYRTTPLGEGFCVGSNCSPVFGIGIPGSWNCANPGDSLASYCQGLIETGSSRLPKPDAVNRELPHQGSIQDHIRLLQISHKVMQRLIQDKRIQDAATPVLLRPDFHKRNIYVSAEDPTVITGLIDWLNEH
ncbi:uncharacterized protein KD926_005681 [Aspergillus affinis]|uniref:uncharacterized protein n=1 Tax=Aspergillus affinis TaxID=1070780 RepID=UPI0022FED6DF|nr:uncharacterized protein KD926_005681 [Aspergillus affinis]KAI9042385.1 hypothetical protein KD926_005681 [Aspergillus affinis]